MKFKVADVEVDNKEAKHLAVNVNDHLRYRVDGNVEAHSKFDNPLIYGVSDHALVSAVHSSFARHWPLTLSPDIVWLTLTQGLAKHIEFNAEALRKHFVAHEGKVKITIKRDSFVKGSPNNDWPGAFGEFSEKIKEHIGAKTHKLIVADYSTTTPVDLAASEVVLMDAMKQYFEYGVSTCCGIPYIELTGTVADWESIREKVKSWSAWNLEWWVKPLMPVLDQFVNASKGEIDRDWWNNFYKYHSGMGSGESSRITGWVNWLFPYISNRKNPRLGKFGQDRTDGFTTDSYPKSIAQVPFTWHYYGQDLEYKFLAGLTGVTQDPGTMMVKPVSGWAVAPR